MKKILFMFGGKSYEHEVSIMSIKSIYENVDKTLYEIDYVYIDKQGKWKLVDNVYDLENYKLINNYNILNNYDVAFPVIHGNYGEDGRIQGLLEMYDVKYVGCNTLTSALCMDKVYTKKILDSINIPNTKYIYANKNNINYEKTTKEVNQSLGYPCFIKPSNAGSSVGIKKVKEEKDLKEALEYAFKYDKKILIEKYINAREVEVAVLGNNELIISEPGEITIQKEFYDYDSKYADDNTTIALANLTEEQKTTIKNYAKQAYQQFECKGLSRIDFFIEKETNNIYLNEINTMPGFTKLSMYPYLIDQYGLTFTQLINKLIDLASL